MAGFVEPTKFTFDTDEHGNRQKKPSRGTRWKARYRDPNGRAKSKTFPTKFEAQRFIEVNGADIRRGEWIDPRLQKETFEKWGLKWYSTTNKLAHSTRRGYWQILTLHLLPHFGARRIGSIDWTDVEEFIAKKVDEGQLGPKKTRDCVSVCSLVMKYAIKGNVRRDNPAASHTIPMDRRPIGEGDVLSMDEVVRLVEATRDPYKPAVWLFVYAGLRPSEFSALTVGDLDFARYLLHVRGALVTVNRYDDKPRQHVRKVTKTRSGVRDIRLPEWLCDDIAAVLAARAEAKGQPLDQAEPLFTNHVGLVYAPDDFRKSVFAPALLAAGLPPHRLYDLRHTHASLLISNGADILSVSRRMGHAQPSVTLNVYGHLFPGSGDTLTAKLEGMRQRVSAEMPKVVPLVPKPGRRPGRGKDAEDAQRTRNDGQLWTAGDNLG